MAHCPVRLFALKNKNVTLSEDFNMPGYESTSGLMVTERKNGTIRFEYCDYGVGVFGDGEVESGYEFNVENSKKLREALGADENNLEEKAIEKFGQEFSVSKFIKFCMEYGIDYTRDVWIS